MNTYALRKLNLQHLLIGFFMLLAAGVAVALTPKVKVADQGPGIDLESMLPKRFGEWEIDGSVVPVQVSPDVQANLDKIYSQTLSRTYLNPRGQRVMLSIAYGGTQNREMQVHRPEVCYPAQGFSVLSKEKGVLNTSFGNLPVMHLVAKQGARIEPITYWVRFGDSLVRGNLEQGFARLKYGLSGLVVDAMLVRVSTISSDPSAAYQIQDQFVRELLQAVPDDQRQQLIGKSDA